MPAQRNYLAAAVGIACLLAAFASGAADEFEGVYRVGSMTCTVAPGKMVYVVDCTDGYGPRNYFSSSPFGENIFFSRDEDDKLDDDSSDARLDKNADARLDKNADRFVFDDHRLQKGTFYGSDGRRFPVVKQTDNGAEHGRR